MVNIIGTPYEFDSSLEPKLQELERRVSTMRANGSLSAEVLGRLRSYFKIKNIYNSNAIEGNSLSVGETRMVVQEGVTIAGKPLKDQAEAKNLSEAIDYLEALAKDVQRPITEADVRQLHYVVLKNIRDADAGQYRTIDVEISGSAYKPPPAGRVLSSMAEFGRWLQEVSATSNTKSTNSAVIAAAAAHTWFVTIHPFVDGNGRVARLLLNLILMRFGFPIAIITKADRSRYYDALEISQSSDLTPFLVLLLETLEESLEEYEAAASDQRERSEWSQSIVNKMQRAERTRASNQYEVWRNAMELLKSVFRQTAEVLDSHAVSAVLWFKDFGQLEFEKYFNLKNNQSTKKTWFFRVDFKSGQKTARYLFFFGSASYQMRAAASEPTLLLAREEPSGSFNYERLDLISAPNVPNLFEIAYDANAEEFVARRGNSTLSRMKIEKLCQEFYEDVVEKHFSS